MKTVIREIRETVQEIKQSFGGTLKKGLLS
jgi:hypothetical protein